MHIKSWQLICVLALSTVFLFRLDAAPGFATPQARPISRSDDRDHALSGSNKLAQPQAARIVVKKIMEGGTDTFVFSGTPSGSIDTNNETIQANVTPGTTYTSTEAVLEGWDLTNIECNDDNSTGDVATRTATFRAEAGETVTCTFTNTRRGTIIIDKVTDPSGDATSFDFRLTGGPSNPNQRFRLTDAASPHESDPLPSGTYSVTEDISTGWALTSATCDNGNVPTDITVAPGITVTCTFTNTKLGSIEIVKDTVGGDGTFSYSGIGGLGNFSLTTNDGRASRTFNDLMPGSYSVTEANPAPTFDFTSLFCDDPGDDTTISDRTATIDLAAGETVTCTFINTKRGTIIIQKSASPSNTGLEFTFQRDFGSFNPNFTLAHDQSRTFSRPPGDYTISEIVPVGWVLSTSCSNGVNSNPATISLGPGQTVTCTFANSALATSIRVRKTATPAVVEPGEKVEYRYEVRNTSVAPLPLTNIDLHDDKCSPISGPGGALNWNTTWVYTCTTTLAADTANTASVTAKDFLGRTVSDTDTAFVDVRPTVTISKTVTPATRPEPGGDFTFALTITNLSAERVRITELSDSYPLSAECLALKGKVLAVGEATRCSYTVTRTQPGLYTNTATVKVREVDRGHGLDTTDLEATASASASFTVADIPSSLAVGKRAQPSALPAPGGPVTFTLLVTNTSPVDSIILTTIATDHNDDGVDDDTFGADAICLTTTLAPGESTHCQFNHGVAGAAGEIITGKTTVQAIDDANIDVAAIATATIYLLEGAPLTVTKTPHTNSVMEPGGDVVFDVTVRNHHPATVVALTALADSLYGDITATAQNGASATDCALVTLPVGGIYHCSFTAGVTGEAGDLHTNTLTATGRDGGGNLYAAQASAQVAIGPAPAPLTVTKRDRLVTDHNLNGQVNPLDEVEYQIIVANNGKQAGTGIALEDTPDPNTALVVGSVVATQGAQVVTGNNPADTRVSVLLPAALAVGESFAVTFRVQIKEPLSPSVTTVRNQALVTGDNIVPTLSDDPDTPAPGDPTVTSVSGLPKVDLSKSDALLIDADEDGFPSPGDTLVYELVLTNRGGQTAMDIELIDSLDENTVLVAGSVQTSQGAVRQGNGPGDTNVQIAVGNLARNATATFSFQATITDPLPAGVATVSNQARVTGSNFSPVLSDDPATDALDDPTVTAVTAAPLLLVSKRDFLYDDADGDDQVGPGDTLFYMIQVNNIGNTTAASVLLTDTPDLQTTLLTGKVQVSQGQVVSGNSAGDRVLQVRLDEIPPGAIVNIGFQVRVNATATEPLVNQATTQFTNPNDATRTVITALSDDPDTATSSDPTVTQIKDGQPAGGLLELLLPLVLR